MKKVITILSVLALVFLVKAPVHAVDYVDVDPSVAEVKVTWDGEERYLDTLQEGIQYVNDHTTGSLTMELLKDTSISTLNLRVRTDLVLDLNGYVMRVDHTSTVITVYAGGTLILNDDEGTGRIESPNTNPYGIFVNDAVDGKVATVIINGGQFGSTEDPYSNYALVLGADTYVTINDGDFYGPVGTNNWWVEPHLTIYDGNFYDTFYLVAKNLDVDIYGGTFAPIDSGIVFEIRSGTVDIMGGTFILDVDTSNNVDNIPVEGGAGGTKGVIVITKPASSTGNTYYGVTEVNIYDGNFVNNIGDIVSISNRSPYGDVGVDLYVTAGIIDASRVNVYDALNVGNPSDISWGLHQGRVDALLNTYGAYNEADYRPETFPAFAAAYNELSDRRNDEFETDMDALALINNLERAAGLLIPVTDFTQATALIRTVEVLNPSIYTIDSYQALVTKLNELKVMVLDTTVYQVDLDALIIQVRDAYDALVLKLQRPPIVVDLVGQTIIDQEKVTVEYDVEAFERPVETFEFTIPELDEDTLVSYETQIKDELGEDFDLGNYVIIDITPLDEDGVKVAMTGDGRVMITIPVPVGLDINKEIVVYHVKDDGTIERLDYVVEGDQITFYATAFSNFIIANVITHDSETPGNETPGNETPGNETPGNETPKPEDPKPGTPITQTPVTTDAPKEGTDLPKTGMTSLVGYSLMVMAIGAVLVLGTKKIREN